MRSVFFLLRVKGLFGNSVSTWHANNNLNLPLTVLSILNLRESLFKCSNRNGFKDVGRKYLLQVYKLMFRINSTSS